MTTTEERPERRGGARPGAGRKARPNGRGASSQTVQVRLTATEAQRVRARAAEAGLTVSEYFRRRVLPPEDGGRTNSKIGEQPGKE